VFQIKPANFILTFFIFSFRVVPQSNIFLVLLPLLVAFYSVTTFFSYISLKYYIHIVSYIQ